MTNIAIIGGGASGMVAAISASRLPENEITIFERQARVGRKLLSTGNGRCNLSNTAAAPELYHGHDPLFTAPALKKYPPRSVLEFFRSLGLVTVEEYGGRVYPMSDSASSVLDVLRLALEKPNVAIRTACPVSSVRYDGGFILRTDDGEERFDRLIIACGSCAGSKLGGVMDGYELLGSLGHSRTKLYPALTQIRTAPELPRAMKGVRCDALVNILRGEKIIASARGDLLFTETGISGTAVFELSRTVSSSGEGLSASICFFPELDRDELLRLLDERAKNNPSLAANQIFTGTVHSRVGQMICKYAAVSGGRTASELSAAGLERLADAAFDFRLDITGVSGFETAQVAAGGADTSEFDPDTLESRIVPGLFACGEVLDVDGDCGGFNLQWAWSSGLLAGRCGR